MYILCLVEFFSSDMSCCCESMIFHQVKMLVWINWSSITINYIFFVLISKTKPYTAPALGTGNRNVCAVSPAGVCVSSPKTRSSVAPVKVHAHVSPTSKVSYLEMYYLKEWYSSKHCLELFCLYIIEYRKSSRLTYGNVTITCGDFDVVNR